MIKDGQVRKLRRLLDAGESLTVAARRTGMDEKTARKYREAGKLPSELAKPRTWRTRVDPFEEIWPEVLARLEAEPKLRAFALFGWLQEKYEGRFPDSQRRTFERRVRAWRAARGPSREVIFPQVHAPGDLGASDFTHMNSLRITIDGQPFDHMLYHFTLTYSNWESVSVCFSESFEAFSRGLQDALWKLGGVPRRHRSDSLSAAVNNLSEDREFHARYRDLMEHYRVVPQRINVRKAHENGDVESSHGHWKSVVEQALLLRGSRDFASREEYEGFLEELMGKRNASRSPRLEQELEVLGELPPTKADCRTQVRGIKVRGSSTIQVKRNTYSVPSRLIGYKVDVMIDADFIEVWYGDVLIQRMPRVIGSGKHAVNYRHVIDSLVRKPGAFENHQYREDMFPTSHFRMAYDWLCQDRSPRAAAREFLKILRLAARESEDAVQDALRVAITENAAISVKAIRLAVEQHQQAPAATNVTVEVPDLQDFDSLLQHPDMEVDPYEHENHGNQTQATIAGDEACRNELDGRQLEEDDGRVDRTVSGPSHADVSGALRPLGGEGRGGVEESHRVSVGVDGPGMPSTSGESDRPAHAAVPAADVQDLGQLQLDAAAAGRCPTDGKPAGRLFPGSPREPADIRETRFGETPPNAIPRLSQRNVRARSRLRTRHTLFSAGISSLLALPACPATCVIARLS